MGKRVRFISQWIAIAASSAQMGNTKTIFRSKQSWLFNSEEMVVETPAPKDEKEAFLVDYNIAPSVPPYPRYAFSR
jgi:hypothetical protein